MMMKKNEHIELRYLELDLGPIRSEMDLHGWMADTFQFPEFYGNNVHALIDCLSSLRRPNDEMSGWHLGAEEAVVFELRGVVRASAIPLLTLLLVVEAVNERAKEKGQAPMLFLS